jgi:glycerol-3-phosphate dehydrogenase
VTAVTPALTRESLLARLRQRRRWDVVVIGGGATGLGCAVDAAARGHSTLLVEAGDFARGTSSRSTKLIHGGVRYLAQGRIGLVREALRERARLLANAPHLVHPQRFVVPARGFASRLGLAAGLTAYDLLAGSRGIAPCAWLDRAAVGVALPGLAHDVADGGVAYWDAQFDDARLAIALMRTALGLGATAINHCPVESMLHEAGRVVGVALRDAECGETFEVSARVVINATGAWADALRSLDAPDRKPLLQLSQGAHVVVDADFLPGRDALLVSRTVDGRVLFAIPWAGKLLIGTTDTPREDAPFEPAALDGEIDFLLATAGKYLARQPGRSDVRSRFVGLRPLIGHGGGATARLSREHLVEVAPGGLITVTGGKWTTYRRMAEDAVNMAERVAGLGQRSCITAELPLHGHDAPHLTPGEPLTAGLDLDADTVRRAVREEFARTLEDVLARRHRALFLDAGAALAVAPAVASIMAAELGRDGGWETAELERFAALARQYGA